MMVATRLWFFSVHAQTRSASRFNLLLDEKARIEISQQLDNGSTLVTKRHGRHIFEISVFGVQTIAVCDVPKRAVVTLMEAKRYYKRIKGGRCGAGAGT
jgi:hypothetical protein